VSPGRCQNSIPVYQDASRAVSSNLEELSHV
jgi:hypothetical protein